MGDFHAPSLTSQQSLGVEESEASMLSPNSHTAFVQVDVASLAASGIIERNTHTVKSDDTSITSSSSPHRHSEQTSAWSTSSSQLYSLESMGRSMLKRSSLKTLAGRSASASAATAPYTF